MKKTWVMANWKMHGSQEMIVKYLEELNREKLSPDIHLVVFPPVIYFDFFQNHAKKTNCSLGAQNVAFTAGGAYTGEISARMLKEFGCQYVLVGHSERRHIFKESDEVLAKKFHIVKEHGMIPVFCIGETFEDYQQKHTKQVLEKQLESLVKNTDFSMKECIIAYEPVWAIGTGLTPTEQELTNVFAELKEILANMEGAQDAPILYGGSVNEKNIAMISCIEHCSGTLIGGASLKIEQLLEIIKCITYC
jgi:triosephosphate isomerase